MGESVGRREAVWSDSDFGICGQSEVPVLCTGPPVLLRAAYLRNLYKGCLLWWGWLPSDAEKSAIPTVILPNGPVSEGCA